jgi:hypothetical protein
VLNGIARFLAAGTGPSTLVARLRRETSPVRRQPRAAQAVASVGTVFPAALLGHELLALVGERLRGLVADEPVSPEEDAGLRRLSRRLATRSPGELGARVPVSDEPAPATSPRPFSLAQAAGLARVPFGADREETTEPRRAPTEARGTTAGTDRREPVQGAALLQDLLRGYWRSASLASAAGRGSLSPRAEATTPGGLARIDGAPGAPLRAPMTEADIARELRAFEAVGPAAEGTDAGRLEVASFAGDGYAVAYGPDPFEQEAARSVAWPPSPTAPPQILGATFARVAASRAAARRELADELAAIVREQAQRHGIDVP